MVLDLRPGSTRMPAKAAAACFRILAQSTSTRGARGITSKTFCSLQNGASTLSRWTGAVEIRRISIPQCSTPRLGARSCELRPSRDIASFTQFVIGARTVLGAGHPVSAVYQRPYGGQAET